MEKEVYPKKDFYNIDDLLAIMKILRGENGCPWDMEQDHHSIRKDVLEEAYRRALNSWKASIILVLWLHTTPQIGA